MAELKPLDEWGVNNEVLSPELFQRFLRVVQGLEGPREAVFKSFLGSLASTLRSIGFSLRFGLIARTLDCYQSRSGRCLPRESSQSIRGPAWNGSAYGTRKRTLLMFSPRVALSKVRENTLEISPDTAFRS
jgi:hypothetical protein